MFLLWLLLVFVGYIFVLFLPITVCYMYCVTNSLLIYICLICAVGKCKVGRKTKKQFRGTLKRCFTFFNGLELREVHIAGLKQTPFYNFVVPFTKGKFTADSVSSMQAGVVQLIKTYSPSGGGFNIGGRMLKMESSEFELIFGITSGDVKVDRTPANIGESSLAQRKFSEFKTIRPRNLKEVLEKHLSSDSAEDVADTVRIVVINLLSSVLYATCAEQVSLWMFRICEDLDKLHEYNWGQSVVSYFMEYVKESSADAVRGSTLLFMVRHNYVVRNKDLYMLCWLTSLSVLMCIIGMVFVK